MMGGARAKPQHRLSVEPVTPTDQLSVEHGIPFEKVVQFLEWNRSAYQHLGNQNLELLKEGNASSPSATFQQEYLS